MTRTAISLTCLTFIVYRAAAQCDSKCNFCLSQSDFDTGTYRIIRPGLYCLEEDVQFNPNPGSIANPNNLYGSSWLPKNEQTYPGSTKNTNGAYALGFFAAISVESSNVIIDLNCNTLSFHKHFCLQQRWGSIIEISNTAFIPGAGPADFGSVLEDVENVVIKNGNLGLTSHHGIHANNAQNVVIENVNFFDFEVGAIQFNGFKNIKLRNLKIGPSLQSVPMKGMLISIYFSLTPHKKCKYDTAYYSNARFTAPALKQILDEISRRMIPMPSVSFRHGSMTLKEVYDNLILSMDIAFRDAVGASTPSDRMNPIYSDALRLYKNDGLLPDGSALYGIVLNSFNVAIFGLGHSPNDEALHGEDVLIEDVTIDNLRLSVNDIPALYFDACDGQETKTTQKGVFGDIMDVRTMIDPNLVGLIDGYGQANRDTSPLEYVGNPLSDAQIAFYLHKDIISDTFTSKSSFVSEHCLNWACNDHDGRNTHIVWPECAAFVCNGDIMFHQNKGVIGLRMDKIENVEIKNLHISNLLNESPLASFTCADYSGHHDGGHTTTVTDEREGAMLTDVRGFSICGGDVTMSGKNSIENLNSFHGDVIGIDMMMTAKLVFDDNNADIMTMNHFKAASKVTSEHYKELVAINKTPYPNNFEMCNIAMDDGSESIDAPGYLQRDDCSRVEFVSPSSHHFFAAAIRKDEI